MNRIIKNLYLKILSLSGLKNMIIFESHGDFSDNTRELFEYMISEGLNKKYKMIWVVENKENFKNKKIENVRFISLTPKKTKERFIYYYYFAYARFAFYSHRFPPVKLNRGETYVNLWHGSGPKRPGSLDMGKNFDYVLCSSDYFKEIRIKNFMCRESQLLALGNPRNDLLFKDTGALSKIIGKDYSKVMIWMPTFRITKYGKVEFKNVDSAHHGLPIADTAKKLIEVNSLLAEYGALLIIKPHPMEDLSSIDFDSRSNIILLTNEDLEKKDVFLYSLLGETDALITDISSVFVDYLLIDKPIGFTVGDLMDYKTGFNFSDPLSMMPGKHIDSFLGFMGFISDVLNENDEYKDQRARINDLLNNYKEQGFSKRIVEHFKLDRV